MTADDGTREAIEPIADDVLAALATPAFHPHHPARVEHLQTHISHVFLAGDEVYKLKKAVRFPFLDFRTRAARLHFCREELRLNRRLAAPIYLDVVAIVRRADGSLAFGPSLATADGPCVEPVLRMRRLPADRLLPALLAKGAVDGAMMAVLARRIAEFHRAAPTGPAIAAEASPVELRRRFADILATLAAFVGPVLHADEHATLVELNERFVATHQDLLRARQAEGRIREGHGDLHAEHVCFAPEDVYVFDCVEFSLPFRCGDVASEVAFLTMDLELRGRRDLADAFAAAYATAAGDAQLPRLLPYYASFRATVRATVAALTSAEAEVEPAERDAARSRARAYVELALRSAWRAGDPVLVVCCGASGTGKSTLAAALAPVLDAEVLRSDVLRKRDDAPGGATADPSARYTPAARAAVYAALAAEVEARLAAGRGVVADATFLRRADRDAIAVAAARHGRRIVFLETVASEATVRARLAARTAADVSDARFDTYRAQRTTADPLGPDEPHLTIATDAPLTDVRANALRQLFTWRTQSNDAAK